jgi:hypothetical protein
MSMDPELTVMALLGLFIDVFFSTGAPFPTLLQPDVDHVIRTLRLGLSWTFVR